MSEVAQGLDVILSGNAFANAFWVFIGVVAGALIQYVLELFSAKSQRKNAFKALGTEIALNLNALGDFRNRIKYLRERVGAGQISEQDLFVSMQAFDYSIVQPLVSSGHFHVGLGSENVKRYFDFMKFFNNENAKLINSLLRTEHEANKSIQFLQWIEEQCDFQEAGIRAISLKSIKSWL